MLIRMEPMDISIGFIGFMGVIGRMGSIGGSDFIARSSPTFAFFSGSGSWSGGASRRERIPPPLIWK